MPKLNQNNMKTKINPLKDLPLYIIKVNSRWYRNTKTGAYVSASNITDHIPKDEINIEPKTHQEYWWNNI